ncbi:MULTISPECIES: hypothetical protein [unclassified Ruegeria]|uniref:hypothetical protein n=1 Tax=unclassified Ruegeria TaxID=2625375 RepID=UPI001487D90F|nr:MULTISPECIES: hypothetical protein [unclassified Ruegeria]NOD34698.1 hypothetical protein [Ruegeria sp. HKCCD7296]NOD48314.1 hypothetical protein [Ruegeria sp. HKCCD5849]NOD52334.1 hypothetical protein [Ruegeria sp. HKCCD5851]NOD68437.1 hypothetical protein [Ruegeria sp. HKCCD7303]NOE34756.1 hypothetical protein [Ruegeria sp. HKCCD7318]
MARIADMKMALLAALIILTTMLCARVEDKVVEVDPVLMRAPLVETLVLAG